MCQTPSRHWDYCRGRQAKSLPVLAELMILMEARVSRPAGGIQREGEANIVRAKPWSGEEGLVFQRVGLRSLISVGWKADSEIRI